MLIDGIELSAVNRPFGALAIVHLALVLNGFCG
jgi:hypothetical protein